MVLCSVLFVVYVRSFMLLCLCPSSGVILEVAEQKCGGSAALARACARGAVKTAPTPEGELLYFFPNIETGRRHIVGFHQQTEQQKAISQDISNNVLSIQIYSHQISSDP